MQVTNTLMLEAMIHNSGMKKGKIAETLGISSSALRKRMNNAVEFKGEEMLKLSQLLGITDMNTLQTVFFS